MIDLLFPVACMKEQYALAHVVVWNEATLTGPLRNIVQQYDCLWCVLLQWAAVWGEVPDGQCERASGLHVVVCTRPALCCLAWHKRVHY